MNSLVVIPLKSEGCQLTFSEWQSIVPKNLAKLINGCDNRGCMVVSAGKLPSTDFVLEKHDADNEYSLLGGKPSDKFFMPIDFLKKFGMWPQMIYVQMR